MKINIGDKLILKKKHPCGSSTWEVIRIGQDFRIKCLQCYRQIMIARNKLENNIKDIIYKISQ